MQPNECHNCQRLLDDQWDGVTLAAGDGALVQAHLGSCLACAALAREMDAVLGSAAALRELRYERPVEVAPLVLRRPRATGWAWARGLAMSAAFGVAVAVAVGVVLGGHGRTPRTTQTAAAPAEVVVRLAVPVPEARSVALLGDFTGWQRKIPLTRAQAGLWVGELKVPAGRYRYVIVVDDARLETDPASSQVVDDGFGGKNSVLEVGSSI